ncbi:MAG TPA: VOC family protein [Sphingobium sp.]
MITHVAALRALNLPINHLAFVVADIEVAVAQWAGLMGAGPFFFFDHMSFEYCEFNGAPGALDHSAAFGQCGPIAIELQQLHMTAPTALAAKLAPSGLGGIGHVGYISQSIEEESARLEAEGFPLFLRAGAGEMEARFHDTSAALGFSIEVHRRCAFIETFFEALEEEARHWDGMHPLRPWAG